MDGFKFTGKVLSSQTFAGMKLFFLFAFIQTLGFQFIYHSLSYEKMLSIIQANRNGDQTNQ